MTTYQINYFWIDVLCDDSPLCGDVLNQFIESCSFDLLVLQIRQRVEVEVEDHATLMNLLDKHLLSC